MTGRCATSRLLDRDFSLLNSIIYFHKAIQELERVHAKLSFAAFLYAIIGATGTFLLALGLSTAENWKPLFHRYIRMGPAGYAAAISIIAFIGMPHIGELASLDRETLAVSSSFRPTSPNRSAFYVSFWKLPIDRYGIQKPRGYAWDIVLLGTTTAMCGMLGIPPANGLLPQAPPHSESLMHTVKEEVTTVGDDGVPQTRVREVRRVYEQRWSAFLHAGGILLFVSPPFMHVLGLTLKSVLAGLFLFMGEQSLSVNPILYRFLYILTPPLELPLLPGSIRSYWGIHAYTVLQIAITISIFIVTLTKAAPAFPVIIVALVPIRLIVMRKLWNRETLRHVDQWACKEGTPEDEEDEKAKGEVPEAAEKAMVSGGQEVGGGIYEGDVV
ncbi:hypothetical protein GP486_001068 [Trichoglossum hirsutum]|uniref:Bicarbonate transporter-like transmembrane domain-containing protein n=1 Tax=Trichoglossum hirsutum TaxID=265104 RepID=A0A9P8LHL2_9PEZI|nr:hypothetical protein GP486_001068 [Trichoglossum hirsutum]